jgi:hypothetical protein
MKYFFINILNIAYRDGASNLNPRIDPVQMASFIWGFTFSNWYLSIIGINAVLNHLKIPVIHFRITCVLFLLIAGGLNTYYKKNDRYLKDYFELKEAHRLMPRSKAVLLLVLIIVLPSIPVFVAMLYKHFARI